MVFLSRSDSSNLLNPSLPLTLSTIVRHQRLTYPKLPHQSFLLNFFLPILIHPPTNASTRLRPHSSLVLRHPPPLIPHHAQLSSIDGRRTGWIRGSSIGLLKRITSKLGTFILDHHRHRPTERSVFETTGGA